MENESKNRNNSGRFRNWLIGGAAVVLSLGAIGGVSAVYADGGPGQFMMHRGFGFGGPFADRGIERALKSVNATEAQEEKVWEIVDGVRSDIRLVFRDFRGSKEQLTTLLEADTVDRDAVQEFRAERIVTLDAASHRLTEAFLDAVDVLTPEQRTELMKRMEKSGPGRR